MKKLALSLAIVTAGAALLFPAVASAGGDTQNCDDFEFQEDAQAEFDRDPSDPNRLDEDDGPDDGIACENLPSRGSTRTTSLPAGPGAAAGSSATPVGGVQTGLGGTADDPNLAPLMAVIALGLASGAGFIAIRRRTQPA